MLDDFNLVQPLAYNYVTNIVKNNSISHAFLVNSNGYPYAYDFVMALVKYFICPNKLTNNKKCEECFLCKRIDDGNYPELKIISPDGMWIKKNQVLDLQDEFSTMPLEGKKRIYIIKDADRMNQQTANSILKFLEEPVTDIIAILVTNNTNRMLGTIVSRCQVINLQNTLNIKKTMLENFAYKYCSSMDEYNKFISDKDNAGFINDVLNFIEFYEKNGLDCIVYSKDCWHSKFSEKSVLLKAFDIIINFYNDCLAYKMGGDVTFFVDKLDFVDFVAKNNDIPELERKIMVSIRYKDKLDFNVNLNLFFDKFIMELGDEIVGDSRS